MKSVCAGGSEHKTQRQRRVGTSGLAPSVYIVGKRARVSMLRSPRGLGCSSGKPQMLADGRRVRTANGSTLSRLVFLIPAWVRVRCSLIIRRALVIRNYSAILETFFKRLLS